MPESQYVKAENLGQVVLARVLWERITDRECMAVMNDLCAAAKGTSWRIALDLSAVMLLASAGLGTLINLHKQSNGSGGKLVIFGLREEISELMRITKLHRLLTIADSRDDAIRRALE